MNSMTVNPEGKMKKEERRRHHGLLMSVLFFFLVGIFSPGSVPAQDDPEKRIKEEVVVTNIQVPVRVLYKGKPITDLTREDFTLYENKKKMNINGFFVKRKKITVSPTGSGDDTGGAPAPALPPRTFVLAFNVSNYNEYFEGALDHLFDKILGPTDHVLVFANDVTRRFTDLRDKAGIKARILEDLQAESKKVKKRLLSYIKQLETYLKVDDFRRLLEAARRSSGRTDLGQVARSLISFLQKYAVSWNQYKKQYLTPRPDRFYYFARYLEKIPGEKFVLNFYQFEFFPRIRLNSRTMQDLREISNMLSNTNDGVMVSQGHLLNKILGQLNSDYDLSKGFPTEEISKLFYKVDTTFHSFFIKAANPVTYEDFDYRTLASDLENVLKGITEITGGKNITSNKLGDSLDTIAQVEDVYYMLTYVPKNPRKKGKLKIKVKNKKYKVLYDDNFRADYISEYFDKLEEKVETPDIKITDFSFQKKILAFTVTGYQMKALEKDQKPVGRMKVRIRLTDSNNKSLFDQTKPLTAQNNSINISLNIFKSIKRGEYNFLIDAQDMFTGKMDNFHENVLVR